MKQLTPEQQKQVEELLPHAARVASKYFPGDEDAQSIASLALCQAIGKYIPRKGTTLKTYCLWYVKGRIMQYMRKKIRKREVPLFVDPRSRYDGGLEMVEIMDLLNVLSDRHRKIFIRRYLDGESLEFIARAERCSKQRIDQILDSCKERLRREIDGESRSDTSRRL